MYQIDADIRRAETLPGRAYGDQDWYGAQLEQIFAAAWQYLPVPVDAEQTLYPFTLLPGSLDEPLLLIRETEAQNTEAQNQAKWHCLSNVCTHRGALLQTCRGTAKTLRCPYHGRSFDLKGRYLAMPAFEQALDFPRAQDHLSQLPLEEWGPLRFTALHSPAEAFADWMRPLQARLGWLPWADFVRSERHSRDYELEANWMLYVDNYLEGLHIPYVHPALNALLDFKAYRTECFAGGTLQVGIASRDEDCFELPEHHPDAGQRVGAYYYWLFPNLMLNVYPWGLSLNLVEPLGVQRCRIRYEVWLWQPDKFQLGAGGNTDLVEREDQQIIRSVGRGVRSRLYDRGRYSPSMEQGVHHFHRLLTTHCSV